MKTTIRKTALAIALAGFGISGAALAAPPTFESIDTNQDGTISPSEAAVVEGLDLSKADANGDGALSREEYEAATKAM